MVASVGRKVMSVGTLLSAIALVRIQVLIRHANGAHPKEMADLMTRLGFSEKSFDGSLMVVGYQYAVLRRSFLEMNGTYLERERNALLFWYIILFTGAALGLAGLVMQFVESKPI
jgi:hypothetical protein